VIDDGLTKEDWVIVAGSRRAAPGTKVEPRRIAMPEPSSADRDKGAGVLPAAPPEFPGAGPALVITASYPGASARVLEDAVAAPIEQQLAGLDGVTNVFSACTNSGEMQLTLTFKKGTDLNIAQVLAQNRVALALPVLPREVQDSGVTIKKRGSHLLSVALLSSDDRPDRAALAALAGRLKDELARVGSVAEVRFLTPEAPVDEVYVDIDREKLHRLGLTMSDIAKVMRAEDALVPAGVRRPKTIEEMGQIVVKGTIRLRDVARLKPMRGWPVRCNLDGKPCTILQVYQLPGAADVGKKVQERLAELAKQFPKGVEYRILGERGM
jgi:multidrug efflux pump subunit AcrB